MPEQPALQERVQVLLAAVGAISADLELPSVLQRIVRAAAELTGARYVALGVLGSDGQLSELVTHGISAAERAHIPGWPQGRRILGPLVAEPRPMGLRHLRDEPRSAGVPPAPPPMETFLAVAVRTRSQAYGNLYLSEKAGGAQFSADDEQLIVALAAAAAAAIANARLYAATEQRARWLQASTDITQQLLARSDRTGAMHLVAQRARAVTGADLAAVVLPLDDTGLVVEAVDATSSEQLVGLRVPVDSGVLSEVLASGRTLVVDDVSALAAPLSLLAGYGAALFVPLRSPSARRGVLVVAAKPGNALGANGAEVELLASFADQASLALDRAQAQRDRATLAVLEDRDRIARDLHDMVIQRLFATGLQLQATAGGPATSAQVRAKLGAAVEELDTTIAEIRSTIFALHHSPGREPLAAQLRAVAEEYSNVGFTLDLDIHGALHPDLSEALEAHVLAAVREGLSNAARHAQAQAVSVTVVAGAQGIVVSVQDDGLGLPASRRESGLRNLRQRAAELGGACRVAATRPHGTVLEWRAPLS